MDGAQYYRAVTIVSLNFLVLFAGFNASQGLQTSIHGKKLGNYSLCVLYIVFTAFSLVTPYLLRAVEDRFAQKWQFVFGAIPYVMLIFANNIEYGASFRPAWIIFFVLNAFVGMGAPIVWTAQAEFVGRCASQLAAKTNQDISLASSDLSARFFAFFQLSGTIGSLISSLVLLIAGEGSAYLLFNILGVVMCLSPIGFVFVPVVEKSGESTGTATPLETLSLAFTDARTGLAVPITLCNGMMLGFIFAEFTATFVAPVASENLVGFVLAAFYMSNAISTFTWGKLLTYRIISRKIALTIAAGLQVALLVAFIFLANFTPTYEQDGSTWKLIPGRSVQAMQVVLLFLAAVVFAIGDSVYESQVPAIFQTLYADDSKSTAAYANYKMWQSLGFALQFGIGSQVTQFFPKALSLLILHTVSIAMIFKLSWLHPFDVREVVETQSLQSGDDERVRINSVGSAHSANVES